MTVIMQMANIHGLPNNMTEKLNYKIIHKTPALHTTLNNLNKRWIKFTYFNSMITRITNVFKNTNIRISFKTDNNTNKFQ
jgi:hypothetical protein